MRARGQRLKDIIFIRTSMLYMRTIPDKMRTDKVYISAYGSFIFINIGLHASKRGTRVVRRRVVLDVAIREGCLSVYRRP